VARAAAAESDLCEMQERAAALSAAVASLEADVATSRAAAAAERSAAAALASQLNSLATASQAQVLLSRCGIVWVRMRVTNSSASEIAGDSHWYLDVDPWARRYMETIFPTSPPIHPELEMVLHQA
jgi:hypothetical protein